MDYPDDRHHSSFHSDYLPENGGSPSHPYDDYPPPPPSTRHDDRDRDRDRDRDHRDHRRSSRDRDRKSRHSSKSKSPRPKGDRDRDRDRRRSRERSPRREKDRHSRSRERSREKDADKELKRAEKTVFVSQIHPKVTERDLFSFFSVAGRVDDIRLIKDSKTGKSKGLAYVEMRDKDLIPRALALHGQLLSGYPVTVVQTQAPKPSVPVSAPYHMDHRSGPPQPEGMKIYVGSLHYSVTEPDIRPVFEAFGPIISVDIHKDPMTGQSKGYAFVHFKYMADAQTALGALNGIEIAGRQIKVGYTSEALQQLGLAGQQPQPFPQPVAAPVPGGGGGGASFGAPSFGVPSSSMASSQQYMGRLEDEDGISSGGRHALMQKLAAQHGLVPNASSSHSSSSSSANNLIAVASNLSVPLTQPTQYVVIKNMFDPEQEQDPHWMEDIKDDVLDEASKHGKVKHIYVDKHDRHGVVYVQLDSIAGAIALQKALNGRWFNSRNIQADFVPEVVYTMKFPEARS